MSFMSKLKFWKDGDDLSSSLDKGFGKDSDILGGSQKEPVFKDDFMKSTSSDTTSGLGGTDRLGMGSDFGQPKSQAMGPKGVFSESDIAPGHSNADLSMSGPSYERPAEYAELKHSPLTPSEPSHSEHIMGKDLEIISLKVDAIKSSIEAINQRLESIERILMADKRRGGGW